MAVVTQPQAGGKLVTSVDGHRDWSTGLMGCFDDCKTCIMAYFCLPCTMCNISSRIGDCALMPFCVPNALITMRARIRTLGGIQGSVCNDCMVVAFCGICSVCQMSRELDQMGL